MRILFVTPYVPSLVRIRPFNLIKYLAQRHEVTVLALQQDACEKEHIPILQPYCECIETVHLTKVRSFLNCLKALPSDTPLQGAYGYSRALHLRLQQLLADSHYDIVHVEHLRGAHLARSLSGTPSVYDSVDCISLLLERIRQNNTSLIMKLMANLELPRTRRYESAMLGSFDRVLVTSNDDKIALEQLCGQDASPKISVVPNGVHLAYPANGSVPRDPNAIVFSGKMSYHANVDAVLHFCQEILPVVKALRPEVTFTIVGDNPTREVQALAREDHIRITGRVPDVRPYLQQAAIAVVPIRYAVGIQNKVLEAMSMGTPVVASRAACRALAVRQGEDLLVANGSSEFTAQVIRLLDDATLRDHIGANGRRYVEGNHEWSAIAGDLSRIYEDVVASKRRQEKPAPEFTGLSTYLFQGTD